MTTEKRTPRLAAMLIGGLSLWAVACYAVHGSAILAYIGIQALTSGIFAWQMKSIEKTMQQQRAARSQSTDERAAAFADVLDGADGDGASSIADHDGL